MSLPFVLLAVLTLASAAAAMALPKLVHCAFCLVLTFLGLAGLYLQLNAEFVGWVQVLVYVGAVAILIVFAILLTRGDLSTGPRLSGSTVLGLAIAGLVFAALSLSVVSSPALSQAKIVDHSVTVKHIGAKLMEDYVVPLEVTGLLLTAALIGGIVVAMQDRRERSATPKPLPRVDPNTPPGGNPAL